MRYMSMFQLIHTLEKWTFPQLERVMEQSREIPLRSSLNSQHGSGYSLVHHSWMKQQNDRYDDLGGVIRSHPHEEYLHVISWVLDYFHFQL